MNLFRFCFAISRFIRGFCSRDSLREFSCREVFARIWLRLYACTSVTVVVFGALKKELRFSLSDDLTITKLSISFSKLISAYEIYF